MKVKKKVEEPKPKKKPAKPTKMKKQFKKMNGTSNLEVIFERVLVEMGINYIHHFMFGKREFDFCLPDHKLLVELDGDFFHVNKDKGYVAKYSFQRRAIKNDLHKNKLVMESNEYRLLRLWESDVMSNITGVKARLLEIIGE